MPIGGKRFRKIETCTTSVNGVRKDKKNTEEARSGWINWIPKKKKKA